MATTVTVYTKDVCKQCDMTKQALERAGIEYELADIQESGNLAAAKSLGYMSAPVVVADPDHWSGFRPDLIAELAARIEQEN